jgi:hypothetical protein
MVRNIYGNLDSPPAVKASVVAYKRWRHLDASVRCHAVELRFIAATLVSQALVQPQACLHGAVGACKVVAVLFQEFSG